MYLTQMQRAVMYLTQMQTAVMYLLTQRCVMTGRCHITQMSCVR